jgi:hypothetical protein
MEKKRDACRVLMGNQKEGDHWNDLDVGGRIILKWILEKYDEVVLTGFICFRDQWWALVSTVMNFRVL